MTTCPIPKPQTPIITSRGHYTFIIHRDGIDYSLLYRNQIIQKLSVWKAEFLYMLKQTNSLPSDAEPLRGQIFCDDNTVNSVLARAIRRKTIRLLQHVKKLSLPDGELLNDLVPVQKTIINSIAVNDEGVMATGGDDGSLWFWDWTSGHNLQQTRTMVQPGSLDREAGINALAFDGTGTRFISCEDDKTIKIWNKMKSLRQKYEWFC